MKIVFICGSLEPGCDGVGDYVRRLANELIYKGVDTMLIAIHDNYINETTTGNQKQDTSNIHVVRIPAGLSNKTKLEIVKTWIDNFNPNWLSLQYVPFSFHAKGFHFGLSDMLKVIGQNISWHIMIHELWIGIGETFSPKLLVMHILQKKLITHLMNDLQPQVIHSHLPLNKARLEKYGFRIKNLPLFSNIEVALKSKDNRVSKVFKIGFFSQMEINEPIVKFMQLLQCQVEAVGMDFQVVFIGASNKQVLRLSAEIGKLSCFKNNVKFMGFLQSKKLSLVLKTCSLGITPVPRHALGKSGSVAAFMSHGIPVAAPVVSPGYSQNDLGFNSYVLCSAIVLTPDLKCFEEAFQNVQLAKKEIQIDTIAASFLSDLKYATTPKHAINEMESYI